ncbi:MAG TPA: PP2C family protein-serine/threonine phosphatase [Thermoanaerobaculia bacterium]
MSVAAPATGVVQPALSDSFSVRRLPFSAADPEIAENGERRTENVPGESEATFHAISSPRRTYTGDFWFARPIGTALWFAIGDVAGKGAASAVWMAMILEELDAMIAPGAAPREPCAVVRRLDTVLRDEMPANRFATLAVGRLEADGALTLANAGHPPLMIVRGSGGVDRFPANGPPVGLLPDRCWGVRNTTLDPGDLLVAYTDGMPEARRIDGTELGIDGTATLAASGSGREPRDAASRLAAVLTRTALVEDDVTLFVLRR